MILYDPVLMESFMEKLGEQLAQMSAATGNDDCLSLLAALDLDADFYMYSFKVIPCSKVYSHKWTVCPCAHAGETARRRCPRTTSYRAVLCPLVKAKKTCPMGDACTYSHSVFEHWLHPSRYKTRLCTFGGSCNRPICFFAHSAQELRAASGDAAQEGRGDGEPGQEFMGQQYMDPGFGPTKYGQQQQPQQHQHQPQQLQLPPTSSSEFSMFGSTSPSVLSSQSPQHLSASQIPDLATISMQRLSHNGGGGSMVGNRSLQPSASSSQMQHSSSGLGSALNLNGGSAHQQQQQQMPANRVSLQGLAELLSLNGSMNGSQYGNQQQQLQNQQLQLQLQQQQQLQAQQQAANNLLLNMIAAGMPSQGHQQHMMPSLDMLAATASMNGQSGLLPMSPTSTAGLADSMLPSLSDLDAASMLNMLNDFSSLGSGLIPAPSITGRRGLHPNVSSGFGSNSNNVMSGGNGHMNANLMLGHHSAYSMHDPIQQYSRLSDPGNANYGMSLYSASNLPPNISHFNRASESGAAFSSHSKMTSRLENLMPLSASLSPSGSGPLSSPTVPSPKIFRPSSSSAPPNVPSGRGSVSVGGFGFGSVGSGEQDRERDPWMSGDVLSLAQQQHSQQVQLQLQQQMWPSSSPFSHLSDTPHSGSGSSSATHSSLLGRDSNSGRSFTIYSDLEEPPAAVRPAAVLAAASKPPASASQAAASAESQSCDATLDTLRSQMQAQGLAGSNEQLVASLTQLLAQLTAKAPAS